MPGSYVVNDGVKGGGGSGPLPPSSSSPHTYKRCLCLIATVFVFTVATVVVLLALNSHKGSAGQIEPHQKDGRHVDHLSGGPRDKINRRPSTTERITEQQVHVHYWQPAQSENENNKAAPEATARAHKPLITTTTAPNLEFYEITENPQFSEEFAQERFHQDQQQQKRVYHDVIQYSPPAITRAQRLQEDEDEFTAHEDNFSFPDDDENEFISSQLSHRTTTGRTVPTLSKATTLTHHVKDTPVRMTREPECSQTCNTIHCLKSMSSILMRIDFNQDPCEDFYKYACDGLLTNQISSLSTEERFRKQIRKFLKKEPRTEPFLMKYKTFYDSCLAYKCDGSTDPVVKFFRPLMNQIAPDDGLVDEKAHNLTHLIGRILLDGYLSSRVIPLFDVDLEFSASVGRLIPVITMPTHPSIMQTSHSDDLYVVNCKVQAEALSKTEKSSSKIMQDFERCLLNATNYLKIVEKAISIFGIIDKLPDSDKEQRLSKILTTIEQVLKELKRLSDTEIVQEEDNDGVLMTIAQLTTECPAIEWPVLFPVLFETNVDQVKVRFNERLKAVCKLYDSMDYDVLHDVILSMLAHDWYVEFMRPIQIADRETYCEKLSSHLMQDVVSNVFMTHVPLLPLRSFEKSTREMFNQLKENLIESLKTVRWMTSEEKGDVISQIDRLDIIDNYPALLKQDSSVISNMVLYISQEDFVSNVLVLKRRTRSLYRNLNNLTNATLFSNLFDPLSNEVQFVSGMNLLFVPLPIVNLFVENIDLADKQKYELFSGLGFKIGQALMRPLELNKLKRILTSVEENEDFKTFEDYLLTESPILKFEGGDLVLDRGSTNTSMNGRFLDDASLRLAMDTWKLNSFEDQPILPFTDESILKTYFLIVAQQFCIAPHQSVHELAIRLYTKRDLPNHFRVNNMMMNSVAFKDTFSCPLGSVMNPVLKNKQFPFIDED